MRLLISTAASLVVASGMQFPAKPPRGRNARTRAARINSFEDAPLPAGCNEYGDVGANVRRGRTAALLERPHDLELPDDDCKDTQGQVEPLVEHLCKYFQRAHYKMTPGKWKDLNRFAKQMHRGRAFPDQEFPHLNLSPEQFQIKAGQVFALEDYYNFLIQEYMEDIRNHQENKDPLNQKSYKKWLVSRGGDPNGDQLAKASEPIQQWRITYHSKHYSLWFIRNGHNDMMTPGDIENRFDGYYKSHSDVALDLKESDKIHVLREAGDFLYDHNRMDSLRNDDLTPTQLGIQRGVRDLQDYELKLRS